MHKLTHVYAHMHARVTYTHVDMYAYALAILHFCQQNANILEDLGKKTNCYYFISITEASVVLSHISGREYGAVLFVTTMLPH